MAIIARYIWSYIRWISRRCFSMVILLKQMVYSATRKLCVKRYKEDGLQTDGIYLWDKEVVSLVIPTMSHKVIVSFGIKINIVDKCGCHEFSGSKFILQVLYVENILLVSSNIGRLCKIKISLTKI